MTCLNYPTYEFHVSVCRIIVWSVACLAVLLLYDQWLVWLCCYCMISGLFGCAVIVWSVACLAVLLLYDQWLVWLCCYCMISGLSGCTVILWSVACLTVLLLYNQWLVWLCCYCMISDLSGCAVFLQLLVYRKRRDSIYKTLMYVVIFSTNFICNFLFQPQTGHSNILPYIYAVPHVKCLSFCPVLTEIKFCWTDFGRKFQTYGEQKRTSHLH